MIGYLGNGTATSADLTVGHCLNVLCTAVTSASVHTGATLGWYNAITIGGDGLGVVAYTDQTNGNIEVAHCADLSCTNLSHAIVDEFDRQGTSGDGIAIGTDGLPLLTYFDETDRTLKVAHCGDVACSDPLIAPF